MIILTTKNCPLQSHVYITLKSAAIVMINFASRPGRKKNRRQSHIGRDYRRLGGNIVQREIEFA
jgi:hypothetical protein